jgi:hypothetical protein
MSRWKNLVALVVVLVCGAAAYGYGGQEKDEQVAQEAILDGIVESHPFPLEGRVWKDWVNNCGDFLSYRSNCIKRWEEVAEAVSMTEEQRAKAKALREKYDKVHEAFDATTTPVRHKLGDRMEEAKKAGNEGLAKRLERLRHVQTHQKLAIEGAASEDLLRLLTSEQVRKWHEYRVEKHAVMEMRRRILWRKIGEKKFEELVELTDEQRQQIEKMMWELAEKEFLPTIKHPEKVSAFAVYGEDQKRARAMADEKLYPKVIRTLLTDDQREKLNAEQEGGPKPSTIRPVQATEAP